MDHRALAALVLITAAALHLLDAAAAARPMGRRRQDGEATSVLALAPAAAHHLQQRRAGGDGGGVAAGKWLPFAGAHPHPHLMPPAYWAHRPVPWVGAGELGGAGAGAVEEREREDREREREREDREREREREEAPSYRRERDGGGSSATTTTTRQEQLAMWASLLNPRGKGRTTPTGWLPGTGTGEAADDEPAAAKTAEAVDGAEVDEQAQAGDRERVGQTYWGNNGN